MVKKRPVVLAIAVIMTAPLARSAHPEPAPFEETRDTSLALLPQHGKGQTAGELRLSTFQDVSAWLRDLELKKLSLPEFQKLLAPVEPELRDALTSAMSIQRSLSVRALAFATERHSALGGLKRVLARDAEESVRAEAAASLGWMNDAAAVDALIAALRDDAPTVREAAVLSLGHLKDERAGAALLERLRYDASHAVRMAAARTLPLLPLEKLEAELVSILDTEQDERVRWMLAQALKLMRGTEEENAAIPSPDDFSVKLKELAGEMQSVEKKLRDDRHDSAVQNDQQDLSIKLAEMIRTLEDIEKMKGEPGQSSPNGRKSWASQTSSRLSSDTPRSAKPGARPADRMPTEASSLAAKVEAEKSRWASLPAASRDEMLQVFRPEVPIRWRKRLEAYFLSVAAEEVRK